MVEGFSYLQEFAFATDQKDRLMSALEQIIRITFPNDGFKKDDGLFLTTKSGYASNFLGEQMEMYCGDEIPKIVHHKIVAGVNLRTGRPHVVEVAPMEVVPPKNLRICLLGYKEENRRKGDETFKTYEHLFERVKRIVDEKTNFNLLDDLPILEIGRTAVKGYLLIGHGTPIESFEIKHEWIELENH